MSSESLKMQSALLKVPGAQLYYEVQGSGPVLLMIPGGPTDAGIFAPLAGLMSDRYTVVRYDPRGNSRSVLSGPPEDQQLDLHGDDAAQLLAVFGQEPAYVLGSSGGAQIGLNLAARHPQRVHTLVAHEPPCMGLLPNAADQQAFVEGVYETYLKEGVGPAMLKFIVGAGLAGGPPAQNPTPPPPEVLESFARTKGNADYFLAHGFRPLSRYIPDVAALQAGPVKVVVGVGETSAGSLAHRSALALAVQLGTTAVTFPGGHGGYNDNPAAFAGKLREALLGTHASSKPEGCFPMSTATLPTPVTQAQVTKDEADILAVLETRRQAHHDRDGAKIAALYAADAAYFSLAPPLMHHGVNHQEKQAWLDSWATPVEIESRDFSLTVSGDYAFGHGFLRLSGTKKGAEGKVDFWMRQTVHLQRHGTTWRIIHDHASVPFYMDGSLRPAFDLRP